MKRQIISRAFYGWLAHCRHLRTVRTHLSDLVNSKIISEIDPCDASEGLTTTRWKSMQDNAGKISNALEVYRFIYFGGCEHSLRKEIWPFLLGHYNFESSLEERKKTDEDTIQHYELTMTEWLAVEAIVRQRDKEIMAANLAKLSSESTNSTEIPLTGPKDASNVSNDVFTDSSDSEDDDEKENSEPNKDYNSKSENIDAKYILTREHLKRQKQIESQGSQGTGIIITNASIDQTKSCSLAEELPKANDQLIPALKSPAISPASSNGGIYSVRKLDLIN